jgi:hypothetical protein
MLLWWLSNHNYTSQKAFGIPTLSLLEKASIPIAPSNWTGFCHHKQARLRGISG